MGKQRGISSGLGLRRGVLVMSEAAMVECGESGMSVRNMWPGEWLKANGGSEDPEDPC